MNARIIKESRALLPAFLVTVGVTLATSLVWRGETALAGMAILFSVCCTLMGASCFGNEFSHHTMPLLLAQPVPRKQIWNEKMLVLGAALVLAYAAWFLCLTLFTDPASFDQTEVSPAMMLAFICAGILFSTPWMALNARNTLIAALGAWGFPYGIVLVVLFLGWLFSVDEIVHRFGEIVHRFFIAHPMNRDGWILRIEHFSHYLGPAALLWAAGIPYFAFACWRGRRDFHNFQAVDALAAEIALPARLQRVLARPIGRLLPGYTGTLASLVRKELQLQRPGYVLAGLVCLVAPVEILVQTIHPADLNAGLLAINFVLCILIIPLITTGISVAEERNLGLAGWQRALPPSTRSQWLVKLCVTVGTCVLLGVLLPAVLGLVSTLLLSKEQLEIHSPLLTILVEGLPMFLAFGLGYLFILAVGIFASTLCGATFRAILYALGLVTVAASLIVEANHLLFWVGNLGNSSGVITNLINVPDRMTVPGDILLLVIAGLLTALLALVHLLASANFRDGPPGARRTCIQSGIILAAIGIAATVVWILVFLPDFRPAVTVFTP